MSLGIYLFGWIVGAPMVAALIDMGATARDRRHHRPVEPRRPVEPNRT